MRASCFSPAALPVVMVSIAAVVSCKPARSVDRHDLDADPIALLPPGAVLVAGIDARAVFADQALAKTAAAVGHALFPIDGEAGFEASRDVDRIVLAEYEGPAADYVGIASGRFDPEKLSAVAKAADGSTVLAARYDGFAVRTVGPTVYAVVSGRTLVVGTAGAVRRALDRARAPTPARAVKPWMADAVATSGAQLAVAADFESAPAGGPAVGPVDLSWVGGLRKARVTGDLGVPGMAVAATLSYADAAQAQRGVDGLRAAARWVKTVGPLVGGVHVPDVQIASRDSDVKCAFTVDDSTLRILGALAPRFLPPSRD